MLRNLCQKVGCGLFGLMALTFPVSAQLAAQECRFFGTARGAIVGQIPPNGLELVATGRATQLGRFHRTETLYLNPDGSFQGQIVFFAANGAELWANVSGQFVSPTDAVGQYQFTGGTGRFRNASGNAVFQAHTPDGVNMSVQFHGRLRY